MLGRLGRWCHNHRRLVVIVWIVGLDRVLAAAAAPPATPSPPSSSCPTSRASAASTSSTPTSAGRAAARPATIVFRAPAGVTDPSVQGPMTAYFAEVAKIPDVTVTSPYDPGNASQISKDGTDRPRRHRGAVGPHVHRGHRHRRRRSRTPHRTIDGVQIEFGGDMFGSFEPPSSETLGLAFAIFILIVAFGSVLAMGLPDRHRPRRHRHRRRSIVALRQPRRLHARLHHHARR